MTQFRRLRLASRGSQLALWQTESVRDALLERHPDLQIEIEVIKTTGDKILDVPLARIGDRALFTKEIDEALLDGRADLAVHSLKDVPTTIPDGLILAAVGKREDPRDVLLGPEGTSTSLTSLPDDARIGTSSLRRRAQLRHRRPDVQIVDLRGNLNTRLGKLDAGDYDAIILAAAGVIRLGWHHRISRHLPVAEWLPAVGQGALGILTRQDDPRVANLIAHLNDPETAACVTAERAFLAALEGGCQVPIAALAVRGPDSLRIDGLVADLDGEAILRDQLEGGVADAASLGGRLADRLISLGAREILDQIRSSTDVPGIPAP